MRFSHYQLTIAAIVLGSMIACTQAPPPAKVTGIVRLDKQPLAEAGIQLVPQSDPSLGQYAGQTGIDGRFTIRTHDGKPVKPGKYVILVSKVTKKDGSMPAEHELRELIAKGELRSAVPDQYSDPKRSPFAIEIKHRDTEIPPLELKSRP